MKATLNRLKQYVDFNGSPRKEKRMNGESGE